MYKYSPDASRLANVTQDGRLIIWNKNSEIHQQYTPSSHLESQITCLAWAPAVKKKGNDLDEVSTSDLLALGTSTGSLMVYSVKQGDVVTTFDVSNHKVLCLVWSNSGKSVVCGSEQGEITICCVLSLEVLSRFKSGKTAIHALAITADNKKIIAAAHKLKVFEVQTQKLLQTFVGHSNTVLSLSCIEVENDSFVLSVAGEDRNVSIWKIEEEVASPKAAAQVYLTLSVNDDVKDLACLNVKNSEVITSATGNSGKVCVYRYSLNKSKKKPIKAFSKVSIVNEDQDKIISIPIFSTIVIETDALYLDFAYGSETKIKVEQLKISDLHENHILAREMPMLKIKGKKLVSKTNVVPMANAPDVKFVMGGAALNPKEPTKRGEKRRNVENKHKEQTLEERIAILQPSSTKTSDSWARLLMQGLQSNNKDILRSVVERCNEETMVATIKTLPLEYVVPFLKELHQRMRGKSTNMGHVLWAQHVIRFHVGFLVSSPDVHSEILLPLNDLIATKTANFLPALKLKGKIEMIKNQMAQNRTEDMDSIEQPPLITYQDESDDDDDLDTLLPQRLDYESDFLDEYLSDGGAESKSSDDDDESDSSEDLDDEAMETEPAMTNGNGKDHSSSEDDMVED